MQLVISLQDQVNDLSEDLQKLLDLSYVDGQVNRTVSADKVVYYTIDIPFGHELNAVLNLIMAGRSLYYIRWERPRDA